MPIQLFAACCLSWMCPSFFAPCEFAKSSRSSTAFYRKHPRPLHLVHLWMSRYQLVPTSQPRMAAGRIGWRQAMLSLGNGRLVASIPPEANQFDHKSLIDLYQSLPTRSTGCQFSETSNASAKLIRWSRVCEEMGWRLLTLPSGVVEWATQSSVPWWHSLQR